MTCRYATSATIRGCCRSSDTADICSLGEQRHASPQMVGVTPGAGVVSGEQAGIAEVIVHGAQVRSARHDVVARVVGIAAQIMGLAHRRPCCWHEPHQPHRPRPADDRTTIEVSPPPLSAFITPTIQAWGMPTPDSFRRPSSSACRRRRSSTSTASIRRGSPAARAGGYRSA